MLISDRIAEIIEEMLRESSGVVEIRRNDLAEQIGCVPSQINYVISSRFTPEKGYIIESRRGGGGYVRITRRALDSDRYLMHFLYAIGESLDTKSAAAYLVNLNENGYLSDRETALAASAIRPLSTLPAQHADRLRADSIRQLILTLMK
jgi:transcriptional regulator CtsR